VLVLGIDPGVATTGYAVASQGRGRNLEAVEYGVIRTPSSMPLSGRLGAICSALEQLGAAHRIDVMAVEQIFFGRSASNVFAVGQARGAALVAAARLGLEVREYTPVQVKQAVSGYGGADKQQVQAMVKALYGLTTIPRPDDAADALAIAACCLHSAPMHEQVARRNPGIEAEARVRR
jgi:crossover junction endodeoxyribonuclease RuvC